MRAANEPVALTSVANRICAESHNQIGSVETT